VVGAVLLLVVGLMAGLGVPASAAVSETHGLPTIQVPRPSVKLDPVPYRPGPNRDQTKGREFTATETRLPSAWSGSTALAAPRGTAREGAVAAPAGASAWAQTVAPAHGSYRGPSRVGLHVEPQSVSQQLGITGVVWQVSGLAVGAGGVRAGLDYKSFAQLYGGNYGSRLTLVELPACALTTPQLARCRQQTPLDADNDWKASTVSAVLPLAGSSVPGAAPAAAASRAVVATSGTVLLAATTTSGEEGGPLGTYGATSLKPAGSWAEGGSTGSFTYSYPVTLPGASSTLAPSVGLDYDSGSVDGETAATQAQANWAGDGWSTGDSFVEQSFIPCADDPEGNANLPSADQTEDLCYDGNVLTLSLDGSTTQLVYDSTLKAWRLQDDDGATVSQVTTGSGTGLSAEPGVTSSNTTYWVITERDGTSYYFGMNKLPGWASGDKIAASVDYEPVYSANSGDPCYNSAGFTKSVCNTPYRWHLDYVTDRYGDAMSYDYTQSTNYYGEDQGASVVPYIRDSYLSEIDYGFRVGSVYSTTAIPDKVLFAPGSRCFASSCPAITSSNSGTTGSAYPDVPYDLNCASGSKCAIYGPTFWSTVRLSTITTEQYSGSAWNTVDLYTLNETEPATSDATAPTLWLSSVSRQGEDTTASPSTTLPPALTVSFGGQDLPNRVDTANFPGLYRYRIDQVIGEMGAKTEVSWETPYTCSDSYVSSMTTSAEAAGNTESCFPVWWTPPDYSSAVMDWFEKYAVSAVTVNDTTGGAPAEVTQYDYSGGAAWHYDDNQVVQPKYRTYGQFRGYGSVETLTGAGTTSQPQTESLTTYYQGMSDDNNSTAVTLTDSQGGQHDDTDQLAGEPLETTVYNGSGGPIDHSTIYSYWVSGATATESRTGLPALTANMVEPAETWTRQAITDGGTSSWRYTETDDSYDATTTDPDFGLVQYEYTHTVPANTAYDQCTTTTYAPVNTSENLVGLVASTETDSVACSGFAEGSKPSVPSGLNTLGAPSSVSRPAQVVSATQTFYDDPSFSTTFPQASAPTTGEVSVTESAEGYSGSTADWPDWQVTARDTYDSYGRVQDAYDGNGNETVTTYTVNAAGLTTAAKITNPLGQSTSTTLDPERGLTLTSTDANGVVTTQQSDALGRLTGVWLYSRPATGTGAVEANYTYAYTVVNNGVSGYVAEQMGEGGGYATTVTTLDSLGRTRETQADTPQGGRMITDDFYDSHGWESQVDNRFWDDTTTPTLEAPLAPTNGEVPDYDIYAFNGLGQVVQDTSGDDGATVSVTTTVHNGDSTTTIPDSKPYTGTGSMVVPSDGGVIKTTTTDPLGRTSQIDEYTATPTLNIPSNTFTGTWYVSGGTTTNTSYGYDSHGNQSTIIDADGNTWTSTYNLLGQATSKSDPDAGTTSGMTYDADGNLLQEATAEGTVSYTYDALDRKTGEYTAATSAQVPYTSPTQSPPSNQLASWVFDNSNSAVKNMTYPVGQLTTSTAFSGGQAYVIQALGFVVQGESTGEKYTIPSTSADTGLSGTYTFGHYWTTNLGLPDGDYYPADTAAGLPSEGTNETYLGTPLDLPAGLGGTVSGYAQNTTYDQFGDITQEEIGAGSDLAQINSTYNWHNLELESADVQRSVDTPQDVDDETYYYDLAGNITSQTSDRLGSSADTETQCYQYNGLDQLTTAWTATDNCATTPTSSSDSTVGDGISSASAYWTTWSYDVLGDMQSQDQHSLTGGSDAITTNSFGGSNGGAHALTTSATTTGGNTSTSTFEYDEAGNMTTRDVPATGNQTLSWNAAGQLTQVSGGSAGTTSYVYAPDGSLLLQINPASTTLYLDGEQLTATPDGSTTTVTGARIIPLPTGGDVVRTGGGGDYYFEIPNQNGTNELSLDDTAQIPTWRQFTPYGAPRGTSTTWIDNRGFLNQPTDPDTGLTYDGARDYDPTTGNFISPDPVLVPSDPQDLNPYDYAEDNPVTDSDPSGLLIQGGGGNTCEGNACNGVNWGNSHGDEGTPVGTGIPSGGTPTSDGSSGTNPVRVSPHIEVAPNDPNLNRLKAAWAWAVQKYGAADDAEAEFNDWWRACTLSPYKSACAGALAGQLQGMIPGPSLALNFAAGIKVIIGANGGVIGYLAPLLFGSSRVLRQSLYDNDETSYPGYEAHHIVAENDPDAAPAQQVLKDFDIDVNSAENGVFLPGTASVDNVTGSVIHRGATRTDEYIDYVNEQMGGATTREEALEVLQALKDDLIAGRMPWLGSGDGPEAPGV